MQPPTFFAPYINPLFYSEQQLWHRERKRKRKREIIFESDEVSINGRMFGIWFSNFISKTQMHEAVLGGLSLYPSLTGVVEQGLHYREVY